MDLTAPEGLIGSVRSEGLNDNELVVRIHLVKRMVGPASVLSQFVDINIRSDYELKIIGIGEETRPLREIHRLQLLKESGWSDEILKLLGITAGLCQALIKNAGAAANG